MKILMFINQGRSIDPVIIKYLSKHSDVYTIGKVKVDFYINDDDSVDEKKLLTFIKEKNITHFFYSENSSYLPVFLNVLPRTVTKVMFLIDTHINLKRRLPYAYLFDMILLVNESDRRPVKKVNPNVYIVTYGADIDTFHKTKSKKVYGVTFDGNIIPWIHYHRIIMLLYLKIKGINVFHTPATYGDLNPVFNQTKILINRSPLGGWNMRLFEALSSGVFLLTDGGNKEIEKVFVNKKHLVYYYSLGDLERKLQYYLSHDNEREKIAITGNRYVRKYYSWDAQVKKMIDIMKSKKIVTVGGRKNYYLHYFNLQCYSFRDKERAMKSLKSALENNEIYYAEYIYSYIKCEIYLTLSAWAILILNFFRFNFINRIFGHK